jgi:hypothetical protein
MKPNKYLLEGGPRWQWHHRSELSHAMWRGARVWKRTPKYLHPSLLSGPLNHPNLLQIFVIIETLSALCLQLYRHVVSCCRTLL